MMRFEKRELSEATGQAHSAKVHVRFQDVDAAGVVFFARYFEYVHQAYELFLAEAGHPLAQVIAEESWAAPLRHVEADYFTPLRFGQELEVRLVKAAVEDSEITLGWCLQATADTVRVCAVVQTVHTFVSLPDFERSQVPESIAAALKSIGAAEAQSASSKSG